MPSQFYVLTKLQMATSSGLAGIAVEMNAVVFNHEDGESIWR